jgi:hypothetical protein
MYSRYSSVADLFMSHVAALMSHSVALVNVDELIHPHISTVINTARKSKNSNTIHLYKPVRTGRCPGLPVAAIKPLIP